MLLYTHILVAWVNYGAYGNYGHNAIMAIFRDMAIVAIDAIVDLGHRYGCLRKRLDIRIVASEADFV